MGRTIFIWLFYNLTTAGITAASIAAVGITATDIAAAIEAMDEASAAL